MTEKSVKALAEEILQLIGDLEAHPDLTPAQQDVVDRMCSGALKLSLPERELPTPKKVRLSLQDAWARVAQMMELLDEGYHCPELYAQFIAITMGCSSETMEATVDSILAEAPWKTGSGVLSWRYFFRYLSDRWKHCDVTYGHKDHVRKVGLWLCSLGGAVLPVPAVERTADGARIQFCWNHVSLTLRVDVDPRGDLVWFGYDRTDASTMGGKGYGSADVLRPWLQKVIDRWNPSTDDKTQQCTCTGLNHHPQCPKRQMCL